MVGADRRHASAVGRAVAAEVVHAELAVAAVHIGVAVAGDAGAVNADVLRPVARAARVVAGAVDASVGGAVANLPVHAILRRLAAASAARPRKATRLAAHRAALRARARLAGRDRLAG